MRFALFRIIPIVLMCCNFQACKKAVVNTSIKSGSSNTAKYTYLALNKDIPVYTMYGGISFDINSDDHADFSVFNNRLTAPNGQVSYLKYIALLGSVQLRDTSGTIASGSRATWLKTYITGEAIDTLNSADVNFSYGQSFFVFEGPILKDIGPSQYGSYGTFPLGKTYFGFRILDNNQKWHYGWGSVTISGASSIVGDMALNEICFDNSADEPIKAGEH